MVHTHVALIGGLALPLSEHEFNNLVLLVLRIVFPFKFTVATHALNLMLIVVESLGCLRRRDDDLVLHHHTSHSVLLLARLSGVVPLLVAFKSLLLPQLLFFCN